MGKMNTRSYKRLEKKLATDNLSAEQCHELINILYQRLDDKPKNTVQQVGMQYMLASAKNEARNEAVEFYNDKMIPYLHAATNLLSRLREIHLFISHPQNTHASNVKFLTDPIVGNEPYTWLKLVTDSLDYLEQCEIGLEPYKSNQNSEDLSLINSTALIRQELVRLNNAVKDKNDQQARKKIQDLASILYPLKNAIIERQIEMHSQINFGGSDVNATIEDICRWAKPLYDKGMTRHEMWRNIEAHFQANGDYAEKKQIESWDRNSDGANNMYRNMFRRYGSRRT